MPAFLKYGDISGQLQKSQITPSNQHRVRAFLMNNGVSPGGANQFVAGLIVTDAKDRQLLPALLAFSSGSRMASIRHEKWIEIWGWD